MLPLLALRAFIYLVGSYPTRIALAAALMPQELPIDVVLPEGERLDSQPGSVESGVRHGCVSTPFVLVAG